MSHLLCVLNLGCGNVSERANGTANKHAALPAGLLQQVISASIAAGIPLSGENALQRYDQQAFDRIAESAVGQSARAGRLQQLTFLRMGDLMFDNWGAFTQLLQRLHCVPELPQQLSNA